MENLLGEFSTGLFIWQTVIFLALLFLLRKFAWKPILTAVKDREESINNALNSAEEAKRQVAEMKSANEALLQEARAERDSMLREAQATKENMVAEAKGEARAEADKMIAAAKAAIEGEKRAALTDIRNQIADLSVEVAGKIIREQLAADGKQADLVNKYMDDLNLN